jgi:hypothetical protein
MSISISGMNPSEYLEELANDIRRNACQPFELSAVVMAPGIPGFDDGEEITGMCVAKEGGRLAGLPGEGGIVFYAFWGARARAAWSSRRFWKSVVLLVSVREVREI